MIRNFAHVIICLLLFSSPSFAKVADPLTDEQVTRFVASLEGFSDFKDAMKDDEKIKNMEIDTRPKAGEKFQPYTKAVSELKEKYPSQHQKLSNIVKPHGFSATEWGGVADRVLVAYFAIKLAEEDPDTMAMLNGMDKSMLEMMPPEMRSQVEASFAMMETVKNAPEADKVAVRKKKAALDKYFDEEQAKR